MESGGGGRGRGIEFQAHGFVRGCCLRVCSLVPTPLLIASVSVLSSSGPYLFIFLSPDFLHTYTYVYVRTCTHTLPHTPSLPLFVLRLHCCALCSGMETDERKRRIRIAREVNRGGPEAEDKCGVTITEPAFLQDLNEAEEVDESQA